MNIPNLTSWKNDTLNFIELCSNLECIYCQKILLNPLIFCMRIYCTSLNKLWGLFFYSCIMVNQVRGPSIFSMV